METRQMTPFFHLLFSALFVTFTSEFGNTQNSFSCGLIFCPFLSVKYLNFWSKVKQSEQRQTGRGGRSGVVSSERLRFKRFQRLIIAVIT